MRKAVKKWIAVVLGFISIAILLYRNINNWIIQNDHKQKYKIQWLKNGKS